ncbi:alkaline phosphatase [Halobacillus salinarum]|uniref:Alkaline phosphatase n=1 Tax=Halobacillus salinarum TaxID=2932257 RepID=A0ABY4EG03_9BACI|nr:alkaline phosphatase [Halobacillus salinarum]UOQ42539.1 alkaline phosphatase [Halobacillus salinarum]
MGKKKGVLMKAALSLALVSTLGFGSAVDANGDNGNHWWGHDHHHYGKAKNVIVFIGDGMGAAHREAIRLAAKGLNGKLAMNDMPYIGQVHTSSTSMVTDSAAAATAMASGVKTYNGAVGVNEDKKPVKTILEMAERKGKSTGLVTTSQITDATPAAFASHVTDRSMQSDIAKQYLMNHVDVLLGGGEDFWYPEGEEGEFQDNPKKDPSEKSKGTQGNLVKKAKHLGYDYVTNTEDLMKSRDNKILGLFANEEMFEKHPEGEGDLYDPEVSLTDMTKKSIDTLSKNKRGFFLMVEEEATDEMSHANNADLTLKSGQELDKSVQIAKDYAKKHRDTLVLVAADHETGGLTIEDVSQSDESGDGMSKEDGPFDVAESDSQFMIDWTTTGHTAVTVPLTAMGPGAEDFAGTYENTKIFEELKEVMNLR